MSYDIQRVGELSITGLKNIVFGGEGLFLATLTGPGLVLIQGLSFDRLVNSIATHLPKQCGGLLPIDGSILNEPQHHLDVTTAVTKTGMTEQVSEVAEQVISAWWEK